MTSAMMTYDQLMTNKVFTKVRQGQFILAIVIYTGLLLMPNPQLGEVGMSDFILHAVGNAILMLSTWVASAGRYKAMGPLFFVVPFSLITELAQGLTDNRTPELIDVGGNFAGAAIGFVLCMIVGSVLPKLFPSKA